MSTNPHAPLLRATRRKREILYTPRIATARYSVPSRKLTRGSTRWVASRRLGCKNWLITAKHGCVQLRQIRTCLLVPFRPVSNSVALWLLIPCSSRLQDCNPDCRLAPEAAQRRAEGVPRAVGPRLALYTGAAALAAPGGRGADPTFSQRFTVPPRPIAS